MSAHGTNEICCRSNFQICSLLYHMRASTHTHTHTLQRISRVGLRGRNTPSIISLAGQQSIPDMESRELSRKIM